MIRLLIAALFMSALTAGATQLYWQNTTASGLWNDTGNWWEDAAATTAHGAIPTTGDNCAYATGEMGICSVDVTVPSGIGTVSIGTVCVVTGGQISGGTWTGYDAVMGGTISGGTFTGSFYMSSGGVGGGTFTGPLSFGYGSVTIQGGTFTYAGLDLSGCGYGTIQGGTWNGTNMVNASSLTVLSADFGAPSSWHLDWSGASVLATAVPTSSSNWVQLYSVSGAYNCPSNSNVNLYVYGSSFYTNAGTWPMSGIYLSSSSYVQGGTFTGSSFYNSQGQVFDGTFTGTNGSTASYMPWLGGIVTGSGWSASSGGTITGGIWIGANFNAGSGYIQGGMFGGTGFTPGSIYAGTWILGGSFKFNGVNYRVPAAANPSNTFPATIKFSDVLGGGL